MTDETTASAEAVTAAPEPSATPTPPEPSHPEDASAAISRAFSQVEAAEETEVKVEPKAEAAEKPEAEPKAEEDDRLRNPDGTFKAKEAKPVEAAQESEKPPVEAKPEEKPPETPEEDKGIAEAPARFSTDARAAWKDAPAPVRGEINRVMRELESGIAEHQERWEPLKEFDALARQHGTDIPTALRQYIAFEQNIRRDPIAGLTQTCAELGLDFRAIVAEVSGQAPDKIASRHDTTVSAMQTKIAGLERQLNEVSTSISSQREDTHMRDVQAFAADNLRFEELSPVITTLLRGKTASDLKEAYEMAERLNPAPVVASPPADQTRTPAPLAQTREASLSITGAPASGSNPAVGKTPASAEEALRNAFAQIG